MNLILIALFWLAYGQSPPSPMREAVQSRAVEQATAGALWHNISAYPPAYGKPLCGLAEVVAQGYDPAGALIAWQASPPHAELINAVAPYAWTHVAAARSGDVIVVVLVRDC